LFADITDSNEKVLQITEILSTIAEPVRVIMRYLFAFLHQ